MPQTFPAVVKLAATPPQLERWALAGKTSLSFGSSARCDIHLDGLPERHFAVLFELERWWLRDLGARDGVWFLGERVHDVELLDGDTFVIGANRFQLQLSEPPSTRSAAMEADVRRDPSLLHVYADWLVERGVDMGARTPRERLRSLRALSPDVAQGNVQLTWGDGFVRSALFRRFTRPPMRSVGAVLVDMAAHEAFCFLEEVVIDFDIDARAVELLSGFPSLRRVVVPMSLDAAAQALPQPGLERVVQDELPLELKVGDQRITLRTDGRAERVMGLTFELDAAWHFTSSSPVRINAVSTRSSYIRVGDVIELADGTHIEIVAA